MRLVGWAAALLLLAFIGATLVAASDHPTLWHCPATGIDDGKRCVR